MLRRSSQTLLVCFLIGDLLMTAVAWVGAYYLRFHSGWIPIYREVPDPYLCWRGLPVVVLLAIVAYRVAGQYQLHRLRRFREEMVAVLRGVGLLALLVLAMIFFRQDPYESRATMLVFLGGSVLGVLLARRSSWWFVHFLRRQGYNQSYALIVGSGRLARKTARAFRRASWMGIRQIGFVEDDPHSPHPVSILGGTDDLPQLIDKYRIEHVFIALPTSRYNEAKRVFQLLAQCLVEVHLVADVPALAGWSLTTSNLDGMPIIGLRESPHFGLNIVIKRIMDIIVASIALLVFAPCMLLISVLVKLTSPGPILYRQERCGLNGQPFAMLKFRSMRVDAEASSGPVMTSRNDHRRTRLGGFLRKTSLDELPQLFNVLRGDMSLVGPRPERPHFIQKFRTTIPNYMARHGVKAGMTGWAQVHGWRGNTSLRRRIQFDLYYITHWNPWLDLRILVMTGWKMFFDRHAK